MSSKIPLAPHYVVCAPLRIYFHLYIFMDHSVSRLSNIIILFFRKFRYTFDPSPSVKPQSRGITRPISFPRYCIYKFDILVQIVGWVSNHSSTPSILFMHSTTETNFCARNYRVILSRFDPSAFRPHRLKIFHSESLRAEVRDAANPLHYFYGSGNHVPLRQRID